MRLTSTDVAGMQQQAGKQRFKRENNVWRWQYSCLWNTVPAKKVAHILHLDVHGTSETVSG